MPALRPVRPRVPQASRVVVLGDLMLDVVIAPHRVPATGTDVPGRVALRQGGSASTTARWLARLGIRTTLITSVGRDAIGRALLEDLRTDDVIVRTIRPQGRRTGRIGVLLGAAGERSFVTDRGAADLLAPADLRPAWFSGCDLLHLPAYSLLGEPLGSAGRRAAELAHGAGRLVSVDVASSLPLLAEGRSAALLRVRTVAPDVLFATGQEAQALAGRSIEALLDLAPLVIVKRGAQGATLLARAAVAEGRRQRFDVATQPIESADTTGAGDAFDAGFLASWLSAPRDRPASPAALHRAVLAGHRAAARQLTAPRPELSF